MRRRVAQLRPEAQQLLATAAVLGRRVDLGVLAGVVDEPIDAVLDALDPALAAGLLEADPERIGQVQFAHAIVAEALRDEQSPARLARGHAAVTRVMERRWAGDLDAVIDELAVHAHAGASAGTAASAVEHGARAAELAMAAKAPGEAAAHLTARPRRARRVRTCRPGPPPDAAHGARDRPRSGRRRHGGARRALVAAVVLADARGDVEGVVAAMRHVNGDDLWSSLDWSQVDEGTIAIVTRALDSLPPGPSTARAELTAALSTELYAVDPEQALRAARQATTMAGGISDPLVEARGLLRLCSAAWRPSGQAIRAAAGDRLLALAATGRLPGRFRPLAHLTRFVAAYELGDGPVADRQLALARSSADALRTPAEWTYVLYAHWSVLIAHGRFTEAAALSDQVHDAMRRSRPAVAEVTWAGLTTQVATELGRTDEALDALDRLRSTPYAATSHWWRAWTLAHGGRLEDVSAHLRAFDGPLADDWYRAPLLCAALEAAAAVGDAEFAAGHVDVLRPLQDYVAIAGSGGLVLGPIALAVARTDLLVGHVDGARESLARAERIAATMGSAPWLAGVDDVRHQL